MLGGLQPIMIFHRYKRIPAGSELTQPDGQPPIISKVDTYVPLPPVPIYLAEEITKLFIESENKNVAFQSDMQTYTDGTPADITQKGVASTIEVNILAKKTDLAVILLGSFIDTLLDKVTSKEYAITYLHGATTVFLGLLHEFAIDTSSSSELATIKFVLSKGSSQPQTAGPNLNVNKSTGALPLSGVGN